MTLANTVFSTLPGVSRACMPLANAVFFSLPGVFRACPTLANAVFSIFPGLRNENRPKYPLFFVLPVVAHIVTSISAPPTPFPAALRFSLRRQHHFQRRSTFTAPPTSFSAALRFHRTANAFSSGAPLCIAPLRYYTIAHNKKKRRENPSLS